MKYIRLFENQDPPFYFLAIHIPLQSNHKYDVDCSDVYIFDNEDDRCNFILNCVNDSLSTYIGKPLNIDDFSYQNFLQIDENKKYFFIDYYYALDWYNENSNGRFNLMERELSKNIKLSDKVLVQLDAKKYNL